MKQTFQWKKIPIMLVSFGSGTEFIIFNTRLNLLIGKRFWLPSSASLSHQVIKMSNMGIKQHFEHSCFCSCCCGAATFLSKFCRRETCLFQHVRFAHDDYLSTKLQGPNVAGNKCSVLPWKKQFWNNIVGLKVFRKTFKRNWSSGGLGICKQPKQPSWH